MNKKVEEYIIDELKKEGDLVVKIVAYGGTCDDINSAINEAKELSDTTALTYGQSCIQIMNRKILEYELRADKNWKKTAENMSIVEFARIHCGIDNLLELDWRYLINERNRYNSHK